MSESRATFILRLWRESGAPPGEWRGEAEHLQTGSAVRFTDQAAMLDFIRAQLTEIERNVEERRDEFRNAQRSITDS